MERKMINDETLELVTGGSIIFNGDCSTCGRKSNDEYKVLNFDAILTMLKTTAVRCPKSR